MTASTETDDSTDIADSAANLSQSFEEMSSLLEDLSDSMGEVADGFASFGGSAGESGRPAPGPESSRSEYGFAAADD